MENKNILEFTNKSVLLNKIEALFNEAIELRTEVAKLLLKDVSITARTTLFLEELRNINKDKNN